MKNAIVLREDMGPLVLARLKEFVNFPERGYVAGQAVASALFELFGDGRAVVYNDVDVFREYTDAEYQEATYRRSQLTDAHEKLFWEHHAAHLADSGPPAPRRYRRAKNLCTFTTQEVTNDYGQLIFTSQKQYEVAETRRDGMLNEVICEFLTNDMQAFLRTFDLNAVQVGVNLETGQLHWTRTFERFCTSYQLSIVTLHTPLHSLIRYFKKKQELQGIFGNDERMVEMVGAAYHLGCGEDGVLEDYHNLRWHFGTLYKERLDAVAGFILPHFELTRPANNSGQVYLLTPRFDIPADLRANDNIVFDLPARSYALREKHRKGMQERLGYLCEHRTFGSQKSVSFTRASWLAQGQAFVAGNVTAAEMQQIDKVVGMHVALRIHLRGLSLDAQWSRVKALKTAASERGLWVYGAFETISDVDAPWEEPGFSAFLDEEAVRLSQTLAKAILPLFRLDGYDIKELTTGMALANEGEELHHCVGGYARSVEAGHSRIVSFRRGDNIHDYLTMELTYDGVAWCNNQFLGLLNRDANPEECLLGEEYARYFNLASVFGATTVTVVSKLPAKMQSRCLAALESMQTVVPLLHPRTWKSAVRSGQVGMNLSKAFKLPSFVSEPGSKKKHWPSQRTYWKVLPKLKLHLAWVAVAAKVTGSQDLEEQHEALASNMGSVSVFDDLSDDIPF